MPPARSEAALASTAALFLRRSGLRLGPEMKQIIATLLLDVLY